MGEKIFDPELMSEVIDALKSVYDPEIPLNIYDLGLIYDITLEEGGIVKILMTLTNPNCPVADALPAQVERALKKIPRVSEAKVNLTFEPQWNYDRLSDEAKLDLGLF